MQSGSLFPSRLLAYAQTHGQRFVAELKDFLRFPSVSAQPKHAGDVQQCAVWLADHLRQLGLERVQVIPTRRHPLVYAAWQHAPGRPTVLIYGHYDVQPADPLEAWHSPPFERPCVGTISTAAERATTRGQMFAHVKALESYLRTTGRLPVNIKCLFEGETACCPGWY